MALPALVLLALVAFAAALLGSPHAGRAAALHLILAVGAMPLIFGAMSHFIPVLTRTRIASTGLLSIPVLALAGGALVVGALSLPGLFWGRYAGALLALTAAGALLAWSRRRRAGMLGRPHPCLAWYDAALACLVLALLAILASAIWPQQTIALHHLHLHLNTLGFVGLTAVSTLAVLLPTVAGRPDPQVGPRLRRDLPWAIAGTLLVAVGSAWFGPLAWIGGALWVIPLVRLGASWLRLYRAEILARHGAAPLLAAALGGLALSMIFGAINVIPAAGAFRATEPALAFVSGFMLPLVSGAASQLLPVWLHPGVQSSWHTELRDRLGHYGGARAVLFCLGGIAAGMGHKWGLLLGAATLIWFLLQAGAALLQAYVIQKRNPS
ncbi:hypothetical protein [Thiobacillus denitrificans]|uniref:Transmembrane protein n=1 Tax=Thiobacillus denitrificans TaxID=36861 RepID=A0A106BWD1_THIDE|nr:hypothetical protein [Thiobacillus denitrificans]KVW99680.1 hypothetical protein ABW22_00505 [Thiobacillus denitrificans]